MSEIQYYSMSKPDLKNFQGTYNNFKEIITREDLQNIGIDPNLYLNNEKNEILISDIFAAAKSETNSPENKFNKELFYTCKMLDAYNKKNKESMHYTWNQIQAN